MPKSSIGVKILNRPPPDFPNGAWPCIKILNLSFPSASPGGKGFDGYIDFSPAVAAKSTHIKSCIQSLKPYGQVSLMGGVRDDIAIPYTTIMARSIQIKGRWMYEKRTVSRLIKMIEAGNLKLGKKNTGVEVVGKYPLEEFEAALDAAATHSGYGKEIIFAP